MPNLPFEVISLAADSVIFVFAAYYALKLYKKEKELEKKENKIDTNYHQIVDDALSKERKILEDATEEANKIMLDAQHVKKTSTADFEDSLKKMVQEIQKDSITTATSFMESYTESLKKMAGSSLADFENIAKALEGDMEKQVKEFRESLLPNMEKELEEYKKIRLKQAEETIIRIIQKASQEMFNKSISLEDHQKLLIDALEKAKAEGVFD